MFRKVLGKHKSIWKERAAIKPEDFETMKYYSVPVVAVLSRRRIKTIELLILYCM